MEIDSLEIRKVDKDTEFAEKLLDFVENFSWKEVKEHTVMMIKNWRFTDWETMFAAIADGTIVGMASFMKTDYFIRCRKYTRGYRPYLFPKNTAGTE